MADDQSTAQPLSKIRAPYGDVTSYLVRRVAQERHKWSRLPIWSAKHRQMPGWRVPTVGRRYGVDVYTGNGTRIHFTATLEAITDMRDENGLRYRFDNGVVFFGDPRLTPIGYEVPLDGEWVMRLSRQPHSAKE
jgi:hypothetical protein